MTVHDVLSGSVTAFDAERGWGQVTADDGRVLAFHCTAVADGSRSIDVGTPVCFVERPGHLGRMEAAALTRISP